MLDKFGGAGKIVAVVSDSYDIWHAIDNIWGGDLKEQVKNQGGLLVIRPDSGEPAQVVNNVILRLMEKFGYHFNSKGYKMLPSYIRVIQGEGVTLKTIRLVLETMEQNKLSAENVAFGMGGALLQNVTRDTMEFAMKVSEIGINGDYHDVYKNPITDPNKVSKKGRLALIKEDNQYKTIQARDLNKRENYLVPVFNNGKLLQDWSFAEIRNRADFNLDQRSY
jgi:nicotinamide phosphoribosyltransferase